MEAKDYIISHFDLMHKLALYFGTLSAIIIEEKYDYNTFGSWWCIFKKSGILYRLIYDGRDYALYLQINMNNKNIGQELNWKDIRSKQVKSQDSNNKILSEITDLILE
jgi:hypothetical protein